MAVSNAIGSQIINILIGLGLPWLITDLAANQGCIRLLSHVSLQYAATFQFCVVGLNLFFLLGIALVMKQNKALLTAAKGRIFLSIYAAVLIGFTLVQLFVPQPAPPVKC